MKKNWLTFKGDGRVTKTEFVTLWQSITHGNQETAEAFFYLADLNDDNIIDSKDLSPLYNVFDTDGKHKKYWPIKLFDIQNPYFLSISIRYGCVRCFGFRINIVCWFVGDGQVTAHEFAEKWVGVNILRFW